MDSTKQVFGRVKQSAMFVLIATVILCLTFILVNIYFNNMQIYRWICVYIKCPYMYIYKYTKFYKIFVNHKI